MRITLLLTLCVALGASWALTEERHPPIELFVDVASVNEEKAQRALLELDEWWRDDYACILVDIARLLRPRLPPGAERRGRGRRRAASPADVGGLWGEGAGRDNSSRGYRSGELPTIEPLPPDLPATRVRERLVRFLAEQTGQEFGDDLGAWRRWYWNLPYEPHPDYSWLKAALYNQVGEDMGQFFRFGAGPARLDEIDWSGLDPGRIPTLDHPKYVSAAEAEYLDDDHTVFGLVVNGEARAYPQRILNRHELTLDRLGGVELAIVFDLLCGTMIPYRSETHGSRLNFKPSGLVYRSNRLIYDQETGSLWSTLEGRPIFGPLTLHDVEVVAYPVVTTLWREWKATHPDTTVLSLDTGYDIDYSRDTLLRRYNRSDRLVFGIPQTDERLDTKEPVLALLLQQENEPAAPRPLAIKAELLQKKRNRVYQHDFAGRELVVVTSPEGAHRVYDAGETRFVAQEKDGRLRDSSGGRWRLTEASLEPEVSELSPRPRLPARRAFWFAWHAQFPDTELVR